MKEYAKAHFQRSANKFMKEAGQTCILTWRSGNTGTFDERRGEYKNDGTETRQEMKDVYCLVYAVRGNDIRFGQYGSVQPGDLIMGFDRDLEIDNMPDLRLFYRGQEYITVPESDIPVDDLAAVIGDSQLFKVLHFRFVGARQGIV